MRCLVPLLSPSSCYSTEKALVARLCSTACRAVTPDSQDVAHLWQGYALSLPGLQLHGLSQSLGPSVGSLYALVTEHPRICHLQ
jgi:hypothetical protein